MDLGLQRLSFAQPELGQCFGCHRRHVGFIGHLGRPLPGAVFLAQALEMSLPEKRPVLADVAFALRDGHFSIFDRPAGFSQKRGGIDWTGDGMKHRTVAQAEITRHIAALLLTVDDPERANLLVGGDEAAIHIVADFDVC